MSLFLMVLLLTDYTQGLITSFQRSRKGQNKKPVINHRKWLSLHTSSNGDKIKRYSWDVSSERLVVEKPQTLKKKREREYFCAPTVIQTRSSRETLIKIAAPGIPHANAWEIGFFPFYLKVPNGWIKNDCWVWDIVKELNNMSLRVNHKKVRTLYLDLWLSMLRTNLLWKKKTKSLSVQNLKFVK